MEWFIPVTLLIVSGLALIMNTLTLGLALTLSYQSYSEDIIWENKEAWSKTSIRWGGLKLLSIKDEW